MGPEFLGIDEAVALATDSTTIGLGGVLQRRRPMDLCAALAASGARELEVSSFLAGRETEVLAAAGAMSIPNRRRQPPKRGYVAVRSNYAK